MLKLTTLVSLLLMAIYSLGAPDSNAMGAASHGSRDTYNFNLPESEKVEKEAFGGVQLKEILKWEDLSDQYVLGYGLDTQLGSLVPFAIYDKTFSTPFYPHFWKLLLLGSLEIGDFNLANFSQVLKKCKYKSNSKKNTDLFDIFASKDFSFQKPIQVDENFWKSEVILWKEGKAPDLTGLPPAKIYFSDLDWEAMLQARRGLASAIQSYDSAIALLSRHEEIPLTPVLTTATDQLTDLEFIWNPKGFYEVSFPKSSGPVHPVKVIDLRSKYSSLANAATFASLTNIIRGGLTTIPFFGPPQLAAANLERAFDLVELLYLLRHSQALNLVMEALDNNPHSPFLTDKLSKKDLEDSVFYLLRARTLLSSVISNFVAKSDRLVPNFIKNINLKREHGIRTLRKKKFELYPIDHTYFGVGFKRDIKLGGLKKLKIYALSYSKFARRIPMAAVDLLHPNHVRIKRNILQGILYSANFLYFPIPGVATILKFIYKELVIREVNRRQMWESGLLAHIHHSPNELRDLLIQDVGLTSEKAQEYERLAIETLENEEMNPLDFNTQEGLIHLKKVEEWIRQRDANYLSWEDRGTISTNDINQSNSIPLQCVDSPCALTP
jgi:hypothetical protein